MILFLNLLHLTLVLTALSVILLTLSEHRQSLVSNLLVYSFAGTLFLGFIRLLFALVDGHYFQVEDGTLMLSWHLMFFVTITTFLIAGRTLVKVVDANQTKLVKNTLLILGTLGLLNFCIIFATPFLDKYAKLYFIGTLWETSGLLHFIAFIFAGLVTYYFLKVKQKYSGSISAVSLPLLLSIGFLSLIHLWELLNESWKVIIVSEGTGEMVERFLWIPVFLFIILAFMSLRKALKVPQG